jgi:hypothetical protein
VEPLLRRIESLADDGAYTLTFALQDGQERSMVARVGDGGPTVPEANLIPGWPADSESFTAALAVVSAMHAARETAGPGRTRLSDVSGGWDVGLGNIVLSDAGLPLCVGHGDLEQREDGLYECPVCGALAVFTEAS